MPSFDPTTLPPLFGLPPSSKPIAELLSSLTPDLPHSPTPSISPLASPLSLPSAIVHTYSDATYHNYPSLGLSFCYTRSAAERSSKSRSTPLRAGQGVGRQSDVGLESIDVFLPSSPVASAALTPSAGPSQPQTTAVRSSTKGKKAEWYDAARPPLPIVLRFPSPSVPLPPRPKPSGGSDSNSRPSSAPSTISDPPQTQEKTPSDPQTLTRPLTLSVDRGTTGKAFVGCLGEPSKKGSGGWTGVWLEWARVELASPPSSSASRTGSEESRDDAGHPLDFADGRGEATAQTAVIGMLVQLRDGQTGNNSKSPPTPGGVWDKAGSWDWESIKFFKADGP